MKQLLTVEDFFKFSRTQNYPGTELFYTTPFTLAISVLLSAQCTDKRINIVVPPLFKLADSPEKMIKLGEDKLKDMIKSVTFFNNKTRNILLLSERLIKEYDGILPKDKKALESLAGIGPKTANVILNILHGEPLIGVDTHILRLSHRFGWVDKSIKDPNKLEKELVKVLPKKLHSIANRDIVHFGRYVCKAKKPDCFNCPLSSKCEAVENETKK
ncbi:MAG: endonuclease III [Alphaproteobacteria bacterium]|nr:endonuclease III [Alphaproteobacteria bacterium]